ncbi:hypothetical protein OQA88_5150 [Cercophora sp. LCS_1]
MPHNKRPRRANSPLGGPEKRRRLAAHEPASPDTAGPSAPVFAPPAAGLSSAVSLAPAGAPSPVSAGPAQPSTVAPLPAAPTAPAQLTFTNVRVSVAGGFFALRAAARASWKPSRGDGRLNLVFFADGSKQQPNSVGLKPCHPPYRGGFTAMTANSDAAGQFPAQGYLVERCHSVQHAEGNAIAEALAMAAETAEKSPVGGRVRVFSDSQNVLDFVDEVHLFGPPRAPESKYDVVLDVIAGKLAELCARLEELDVVVDLNWIPRDEAGAHVVMDDLSRRGWTDQDFVPKARTSATAGLDGEVDLTLAEWENRLR